MNMRDAVTSMYIGLKATQLTGSNKFTQSNKPYRLFRLTYGCCYNIQEETGHHSDERILNHLLSYELVTEGEREETYNIYLEKKPLR